MLELIEVRFLSKSSANSFLFFLFSQAAGRPASLHSGDAPTPTLPTRPPDVAPRGRPAAAVQAALVHPTI